MKAIINGITVEGTAAEIADAALKAGVPATAPEKRKAGRPRKDGVAPAPVKVESWKAEDGIPSGLPVSDGKTIGFTLHTPQKGMREGRTGLYIVVGEGPETDQVRAGFHYVKDAAGCVL